jgi:predicted nucleic acid-binding protein
MKNITALIDINVILDDINDRAPWKDDAHKIMLFSAKKMINGYISEHSFPTIYYILRKDFPDDATRRTMIQSVNSILETVSADNYMVKRALDNTKINDFEDCIQVECANKIHADYIITRDIMDFTNSSVQAITPTDFIRKIEGNNETDQ